MPDSGSLLDYVNAYFNILLIHELLSAPFLSEENLKDSGMDSTTLDESLDESQKDEPMSEIKTKCGCNLFRKIKTV